MKRVLLGSAVVVVGLAMVACGGSGGDDGAGSGAGDPGAQGAAGPGTGPIVIGADGVPVGPDGKPLEPKLDGTYTLSTALDLTSTGILPPMASQTLKALSDFDAHPTQTLVDLMNAANVPIAGQLLDDIPSILRDPLFGFIDDHVFKALYQNVPVTKHIADLLTNIGDLATKFDVESSLVVPPPDAVGDAQGTHALTGLGFHWNDKLTVVNAPDVAVELETKPVSLNVVALEKRTAALETARLQIDDHTFTLPIGSFVSKGADLLAADFFGAKDLRDAIGKVVDCAALAKDVAGKCAGVGPAKVCVGHESDLTTFCDAGLDVLVSEIHAQLKQLDVPALHYASGTAKMWDAKADGSAVDAVVDRIDDGYWTAGVGKNDVPILATFTGVRAPDAPQ